MGIVGGISCCCGGVHFLQVMEGSFPCRGGGESHVGCDTRLFSLSDSVLVLNIDLKGVQEKTLSNKYYNDLVEPVYLIILQMMILFSFGWLIFLVLSSQQPALLLTLFTAAVEWKESSQSRVPLNGFSFPTDTTERGQRARPPPLSPTILGAVFYQYSV